MSDEAETPPQEEGEATGCCSCCVEEGHKEKRPLFDKEDLEKHPVLDNPHRRTGSLCCCLGSDWPALLIFMAVVGGCFILWCLAFTKGQVDIALHGMNWMGHICGHDALADAPFQAWVNPTVTSSIFATSVCVPACPIINGSATVPVNDQATIAQLKAGLDTMTAGTAKTSAEAALTKLDNRVTDLKQEVTYMQAQLGDTTSELDRTTMNCVCNPTKYPTFLAYNQGGVNIKALCEAAPANVRGYIQVSYSDNLAQFVGDGSNLALDPQAMEKVPCAFKYRTAQTFTRCMPWVSANSLGRITEVEGTTGISDSVSASFNAAAQRVVAYTTDLEIGRNVLISCSAISLVLSILLIYFMSCSCFNDACQVLYFIVWGVLITLLFVLSGLTAILGYQAKFYKERFETVPALTTQTEDEQSMYIYGVSACVAGLATFCHLIFISPCVCGTQINNSIQIIVAASRIFDRAYAVLLYPLIHNLAIVVAIVCWIIGLVFIATAGEVLPKDDGVHTLHYDENFQKALGYYFVCIIWIVEFMGATGFMIVVAAILVVFFDNPRTATAPADATPGDGQTEGDNLVNQPAETQQVDVGGDRWPLWCGVKLVLCNHLGTAAIGSFFITLVVLIRAAVAYLMEELKKNDETGWGAYIAACVNACCACIEECMRYMVNTAYILTVLEGRWFFSAVCGGLYTLLANAGQVMATNYIAFCVLTLCKLFVPLATTAIAYFMIESGKLGCTKEDLSSTFNILVPVFIIACLFSFTFLGLLGTAIDVVLIAFLKIEDMDNDNPEMKLIEKIPENIKPAFATLQAARDAEKAEQDEAAKEAGGDDIEKQDGDAETDKTEAPEEGA